jgi:hypothetical protein
VIELALVGLLVAGLVGLPALLAMAPAEVTFGLGVLLVTLGMVVGVPAGAVYHVRLFRAVRPTKVAWWLHPTGLHGRLADRDRPRVLRWMRVGAVGFVVALLGCLFIAVGAYRS